MVSKRKHPKFLRPNYGRSSRSRIKIAWRRPRGIDNKKRVKIAYMGASPSIGYRQPNAIRDMHPQGMHEALVETPSQLSGLAGVAIRLASGVGRKKREEIIKLAESMKLRVLNKSKKYPVKAEKPKTDTRVLQGKTAPIGAAGSNREEKKPEAKKVDAAKPEEKKTEMPKADANAAAKAESKTEAPKA